MTTPPPKPTGFSRRFFLTFGAKTAAATALPSVTNGGAAAEDIARAMEAFAKSYNLLRPVNTCSLQERPTATVDVYSYMSWPKLNGHRDIEAAIAEEAQQCESVRQALPKARAALSNLLNVMGDAVPLPINALQSLSKDGVLRPDTLAQKFNAHEQHILTALDTHERNFPLWAARERQRASSITQLKTLIEKAYPYAHNGEIECLVSTACSKAPKGVEWGEYFANPDHAATAVPTLKEAPATVQIAARYRQEHIAQRERIQTATQARTTAIAKRIGNFFSRPVRMGEDREGFFIDISSTIDRLSLYQRLHSVFAACGQDAELPDYEKLFTPTESGDELHMSPELASIFCSILEGHAPLPQAPAGEGNTRLGDHYRQQTGNMAGQRNVLAHQLERLQHLTGCKAPGSQVR